MRRFFNTAFCKSRGDCLYQQTADCVMGVTGKYVLAQRPAMTRLAHFLKHRSIEGQLLVEQLHRPYARNRPHAGTWNVYGAPKHHTHMLLHVLGLCGPAGGLCPSLYRYNLSGCRGPHLSSVLQVLPFCGTKLLPIPGAGTAFSWCRYSLIVVQV